jgi:hypothetical protein
LLLKRGVITIDQANAADEFRQVFQMAHLDPLRAADMARIPGGRWRPWDAPVRARRRVMDTLTAFGGTKAIPGSCLWHVVGREEAINRWAIERAGLDRHDARGVLICVVNILAVLYAGRQL